MAGGVEEAGVFDDGVAVTDGGGVSDSVVAGDGEADGFVELIEDAVDGLFGSPGLFHGEEVCFEFRGGDITVGGPEISEKFECGEVAPTEFFVVKALNVCGRKSGEELFEKRLVGVDVGGEDFLVFDVLTVCFGDLRCGGSREVNGLDGRVNRWVESDTGDGSVGGGGDGESEVAVIAVATVGVDRLGVAVKLCLGNAKGCVAWFFGGSCDDSEGSDWEVGSWAVDDGGSGHDVRLFYD